MPRTVYPDSMQVILPEPYLTAIGKVCVQWAQLEMTVELAVYKFASIDHEDWRSKVITAHMSWPMRMDILSSLVDGLQAEYPHLQRFRSEVKPALDKAAADRNRIVHAFWGFEPETQEASILRATARGRLKASVEPVTVADIERIVEDIGRAGMLVWKLVLNH